MFLRTKNSMKFAKERLKESDLIPKILYGSKETIAIQLVFLVRNFSKLKINVIYYASAKMDNYTWACKLVIANATLFAFMSTNANLKEQEASICKARGDLVVNSEYGRCGKLMISEFCRKAIMDPKNDYLHNDNLIIMYNFEIEESENYHCSLKSVMDSDEYYEAFQYLHLLPADIKLLVNGAVIQVNKEILTKHSTCFAELFKNNPAPPNKRTYVVINEDPEIFNFVVIYIYSGELRCVDEGHMIEVYRIANTLQIVLLEEACMEYFELNLSLSNAQRILDKATLYKLVDLKNAAARLIISHNSNVLHSLEFLCNLKNTHKLRKHTHGI